MFVKSLGTCLRGRRMCFAHFCRFGLLVVFEGVMRLHLKVIYSRHMQFLSIIGKWSQMEV